MWGLHRCLIVKESACNEGDTGDMNLIPGSGRCPGEGLARIVSSILAWKLSWTEEPGGLQSIGLQKVSHDWAIKHKQIRGQIRGTYLGWQNTSVYWQNTTVCWGQIVKNGIISLMVMSLNKFQKLVMDREAWRAAAHGVTKRWTWLSDWTELKW